MASESIPPVPSGGNLKYGIIGVVLIAGAVAVWLGMQSCEQQPAPAVVERADAGAAPIVDRGGALAMDDLVIPDLVPDAGTGPQTVPDAGQRVRVVTRQVGGGEWDCTGTIPPAAARARLAEESLQFRNCYERRLKVNHQLEGRVNVQMRVDRTGAVSAVAVGGSMRDGEVLSCVRRIARNIRFPPPQGGSCAVVAVPFNFTPNQ